MPKALHRNNYIDRYEKWKECEKEIVSIEDSIDSSIKSLKSYTNQTNRITNYNGQKLQYKNEYKNKKLQRHKKLKM